MKTLRHVVAGVLATLFVVLGGPAFAQPNLRVDGFDVEQVPQLSPGTQLNFSVFGTPGAQATVRIDGTTTPLTLVEVQPGVYEGSHTITGQDHIAPDSRVIARLRLHDEVALSVLDEPLMLGTERAPTAQAPEPTTPPWSTPVPPAPSRGLPVRSIPSNEPRYAAAPEPAYPATPPPPQITDAGPPACAECGVVEAINRSPTRGGRGVVGSLVGGVVGAIFGNQFGRGDGRRVARVLGAIGGALTGREIERRNAGAARYEMLIRLDGGARQAILYDNPPPFRVGDRVRLADGSARPYR